MSPLAIDAHMHVIPADVLELIEQDRHPAGIVLEPGDGVPMVVHREGYRYPLEPEFHDERALLAALHKRGAQAAVVSPAPPLFGYDLERAVSLASARLTNDGVAAIAAAHPGEIAGFGTLPLGSPEDAVAELIRAVDELGLLGVQIGPVAAGRWLDHHKLLPVLEQAQELGAVLFVHPYYMGPKPGLEPFYLTNLAGNPLDTALCASRLILSGTMDKVPEIKIMLAHGGGYLPYQAGRLAHGNEVRPELGLCARVPTEYLSRFLYDTIVFDVQALRFLIDKVGADRVLYGSDEPFDMSGGGIEQQLGGVELNSEQWRAIAAGTIAAATGFQVSEDL
jgi:aminocarboxymuconate-semialdehyde decarboxylase